MAGFERGDEFVGAAMGVRLSSLFRYRFQPSTANFLAPPLATLRFFLLLASYTKRPMLLPKPTGETPVPPQPPER